MHSVLIDSRSCIGPARARRVHRRRRVCGASSKRVIEGEVRFDKVSRALYSTDASVYQIEPLGVVVVKSRDDVVRDRPDLPAVSAVR